MNVDYSHDSKCVVSIIISISDHTSWFASAFSFALSQSIFLLVFHCFPENVFDCCVNIPVIRHDHVGTLMPPLYETFIVDKGII